MVSGSWLSSPYGFVRSKQKMIQDLELIKDFLFSILDRIVVLYFSGGLFSVAFAIYIVRKISTLIDRLR